MLSNICQFRTTKTLVVHIAFISKQPCHNWKTKVVNMALSGFKIIFTMNTGYFFAAKKNFGWYFSTPWRGVLSWKFIPEFIPEICDFSNCWLWTNSPKNLVPLQLTVSKISLMPSFQWRIAFIVYVEHTSLADFE